MTVSTASDVSACEYQWTCSLITWNHFVNTHHSCLWFFFFLIKNWCFEEKEKPLALSTFCYPLLWYLVECIFSSPVNTLLPVWCIAQREAVFPPIVFRRAEIKVYSTSAGNARRTSVSLFQRVCFFSYNSPAQTISEYKRLETGSTTRRFGWVWA